ncbi:MAG: hypothetical protein ACKVOW_17655 [Chitinophagaceae bacterium]
MQHHLPCKNISGKCDIIIQIDNTGKTVGKTIIPIGGFVGGSFVALKIIRIQKGM